MSRRREKFSHPGLSCPLCAGAEFGIVAGVCAECIRCRGRFKIGGSGRLEMIPESVTKVVTRMNDGLVTLTADGRKMAVEAATVLRDREDGQRYGERYSA